MEVLLVAALLAILGGASVPLSKELLVQTDRDAAAIALSHAVRSARVRAIAQEGDQPWGVRVAAGTITVFRGSSWASRTTSEDVSTPIASSLTVSPSPTDIIFAKGTGIAASGGTITLTPYATPPLTVTVSPYGMVSF